jgi:hypothetical protein
MYRAAKSQSSSFAGITAPLFVLDIESRSEKIGVRTPRVLESTCRVFKSRISVLRSAIFIFGHRRILKAARRRTKRVGAGT